MSISCGRWTQRMWDGTTVSVRGWRVGGWEDVGNGKEVRIIYGARWIDIDISYVIKWTKPFPPFLHIIRDPKLGGGEQGVWTRLPCCCPVTYSLVLSSPQPCAPNKTGSWSLRYGIGLYVSMTIAKPHVQLTQLQNVLLMVINFFVAREQPVECVMAEHVSFSLSLCRMMMIHDQFFVSRTLNFLPSWLHSFTLLVITILFMFYRVSKCVAMTITLILSSLPIVCVCVCSWNILWLGVAFFFHF